jgi:glycogen operon protein
MNDGTPLPLGATASPEGVNFALAAPNATAVELCLFDGTGAHEQQRLRLQARTDGVWHARLPGARPGLVYGWRVHGPWSPAEGLRFNPAKLLLDPYAREIVGSYGGEDLFLGHDPAQPLQRDARDNAAIALKARVTTPLPAAPPGRSRIPAGERVLYEVHVRGQTRRHPGVPEALRGSYAGLGSEAAVAHLRDLGVTAVELLPVHACITESRLEALGLVNYWGYNTIGFFCADPRLSSSPIDPGEARLEFRAMVEALHAAGIEVILDVVYNHTAESDETGPTLSFRGLDNASYYHLVADDRARYENWTGTGNTLNLGHPRVAQLVLDSLRYWHDEMGVDGFRFDLASVLGRNGRNGFDAHAPFFVALAQDPTLAGAKLIAEPWDIGHGGYQLGRFPGRFAEWNDRFRDGTRLFWLSRGVSRGEFARRVTASSDKFQHGARAVGVGQLRRLARRLHLGRPRRLQPPAQPGERRAQPRRPPRELQHQLRYRGTDAGRPGARAARPPGARDAGDDLARAGHADAAGRRRIRPQPARQQQRLLPGQRDQLARLVDRRSRARRLHRRARRAAARASAAAPGPLAARRRARRQRCARRRVAGAAWWRDDGRRLARWQPPRLR